MTSEEEIKSEIARLTASINQYKSTASSHTGSHHRTNSRSNTYVNPNYKHLNNFIRPNISPFLLPQVKTSIKPPATQVKDVVIDGIAFQSSARSLVRKDHPKVIPSTSSIQRQPPHQVRQVTRKSAHLIPNSRVYKPKTSHGRTTRLINRNMTLHNTARLYPIRRAQRRLKYSEKPCPRFTTTGTCSRGLTCAYQHDPLKVAICWNFLQGNCSINAESCNLSHDPTPQRTPLCLHFLNKGRCTRDICLFPHVNVGPRDGICRDFAVLGYCERGLDCAKQHVRECPDFAERETCTNRNCKLPHVIRANRTRKTASSTKTVLSTHRTPYEPAPFLRKADNVPAITLEEPLKADDTQLGDEYISLVFNESESEEESNDEVEADEAKDLEGGVSGSDAYQTTYM